MLTIKELPDDQLKYENSEVQIIFLKNTDAAEESALKCRTAGIANYRVRPILEPRFIEEKDCE